MRAEEAPSPLAGVLANGPAYKADQACRAELSFDERRFEIESEVEETDIEAHPELQQGSERASASTIEGSA